MENPNYKNKNIETKDLSNIRINPFLKLKNSLWELEKDLIELIERIKELEELFFKTKYHYYQQLLTYH